MPNISEYLLTIAIPTFNRAPILDGALARIIPQITSSPYPVEFIISDNCSSDTTQEVVMKYINFGLRINYIRNDKNLGMDGNFVQCFKMAKGKYVWVLGDDDYLKDGSLDVILSILNESDYGLIHLNMSSVANKSGTRVFSNAEIYLSEVSYWITFISANIVNTKYVMCIDFEKYIGTYFTLIPLYTTAAIKEKMNLMIDAPIIDYGKDIGGNGGYNYFKVFVDNYLSLVKDYSDRYNFKKRFFRTEKKRVFNKHIVFFIYRLLFTKDLGNFKADNAFSYLLKYYKYSWYFYHGLVKCFIKTLLVKTSRLWLKPS